MTKTMFFITAFIGLILVGGVCFGYYTMKMNANSFKGIALPVKGLDDELSKKWEEAFESALKDKDLLRAIVDETDYAAKLEVPAGEAVAHLEGAIKVRFVKRKGQIEIGLVGKRKQNEALAEIASVIYGKAQEVAAKSEPTFGEYLEMLKQAKEDASEGR
ncbi:MAG: hypothetical protein ACJAVK_002170 [Akkermansiaceae bacterium]|jgi:hypothetical protein